MDKESLQRCLGLLDKLGQRPAADSAILDFGCGAGGAVYAFADQGFRNAVGFDNLDYLKLRAPEDRVRFRTGWQNGRLPFEDNSFDFIFSEEVFEHVHDQVLAWRELYRIMKPGSVAIHAFPGPHCLVEPHNYVPFGGSMTYYWWFKLWAMLGIRNETQKTRGFDATQTARWNTFRIIENTNYINSSSYKVMWETIGYEWRWLTQDSFDMHHRGLIRLAGALNRIVPLIGLGFRTFVSKKVLLRKPVSAA
jgi:SAM-dependent methyltransferase